MQLRSSSNQTASWLSRQHQVVPKGFSSWQLIAVNWPDPWAQSALIGLLYDQHPHENIITTSTTALFTGYHPESTSDVLNCLMYKYAARIVKSYSREFGRCVVTQSPFVSDFLGSLFGPFIQGSKMRCL
jgi:hypothetical protein